MKKLSLLFIILLLSVSNVDLVSAHSGRTDSSGGHNCSEKSKAKGLCSGYHYHNGGGGSSSGGSSTGSSSNQSADKDCSDFSSYEEVVKYWNAKGYSKTYDPENLDGWGNTVDDGIPCEAPSGYDTSKINGSPEQIAKQNAAKDKANGETEGYKRGLSDGYSEKESNSTPVKGSDAYIEGYRSAYKKGYEEGKSKINAEKEQAEKEGYALGQKTDKLELPGKYNKNVSLKSSYESGFNKALNERIKEKEKEYYAMGFKNGKDDIQEELNGLEENFLKSYSKGFEEGQKKLKQRYFDKGYQDAFKYVNFKKPNLKKDKYVEWYKEGFNSNTEVKEIQSLAYNMGQSGKVLEIPEKYIASKKIFNHYYEIGAEEYQDQQQKENTQTALGFVALITGWLGRRFYVAKKMIA
ncbi:YHYH domain-containing protein [Pseudalkalibacillus sp. Hm43]|uniref:YHYH domain-containing protein n=1 Tax=Pseudalkalibacillus sp. Hm43 TaxID=3450742 RepID=UPI003F428633